MTDDKRQAFIDRMALARANKTPKVTISVREILDQSHFNPRQRAQIENMPQRYQNLMINAYKGTLSAKSAIKARCIHCCGYEDVQNRVRECTVSICPLLPLRPFQNKEEENEDVQN